MRATRQRDNKRRHRARQREFIKELQQRVNDARHHEVDATKEVQAAAQKVVEDNKRLRELLYYMGVDHVVIESWLREEKIVLSPHHTVRPESPCSSVSKPVATPVCSAKQTCSKSTQTYTAHPSLSCSSDAENHIPLTSSIASEPLTHKVDTSLEGPGQRATDSTEDGRQCLSVSHFLNGANVETWQGSNSRSVANSGGDVECSRAYQMVMPFASSHDKVEAISERLKAGCVIDKKHGGCKVKADVMWEVLEDAMNRV